MSILAVQFVILQATEMLTVHHSWNLFSKERFGSCTDYAYIRLEPRIKFSFVCTLSLTAKNISTDNFKECSEGRHRKIESFYLLNSAMYQDSDTKMKTHLKLLINLLHQLHSVSFLRDIISVCLLEMFHNPAIPLRKI